ncbi:hypothetical protein SAMN05444424_0731 [Bittarella massiliensis (ex Durand et al. 2017)]|uniref:Uncharacterized protein n=1 Tax=Bittarella massiliensis (ex Durand et al. 2017) TaxID=1720313 RepID=A0AAQ1MCJ9_9FIRM|nr:hypothetical protein SAMN05444424_0731 [Bittarella massiliensis (ex Durand et al. 2017)]
MCYTRGGEEGLSPLPFTKIAGGAREIDKKLRIAE